MSTNPSSKNPNDIPIVGILGGVGPMAGVILHRLLIENTQNVKKDQDHLEVVHLSSSPYVNDRTKYLQLLAESDGKADEVPMENPGVGMLRAARAAQAVGISGNKPVIIGVPCNTFHSSAVFSAFVDGVNALNADKSPRDDGYLHLLHMIELTANSIKNDLGLEQAGILCTTGTRQSRLYQGVCGQLNLDIVDIDEELQGSVQDGIYNQEDGLKVLSAACPRVRSDFEGFIRWFKERGVGAVILGCTEIPIALPEENFEGVALINPMTALAKAMVSKAAELSS